METITFHVYVNGEYERSYARQSDARACARRLAKELDKFTHVDALREEGGFQWQERVHEYDGAQAVRS